MSATAFSFEPGVDRPGRHFTTILRPHHDARRRLEVAAGGIHGDGWASQTAVSSQTRSTDRVEVSSRQVSSDRRFHYYSILFAIAMLLASRPLVEESGRIGD